MHTEIVMPMHKQLEILRHESESSLRTLYALKQFKIVMTKDEVVECANKNVYFWRLFEAAFQSRLFIGLRRIYDSGKDTFNIHKFIIICKEKIHTFSIKELRARKSSHRNAHEWIDEFMEKVYEPTVEDFNKLDALVRDNSRRIKKIYTPAASKIYAHAIHTDQDEISNALSDLNFDEIERALNAVWHVYQQVRQLYENGKKPNFDIQPYPYVDEVNESVLRQLKALA
jgi:hypothetical protein